MSRFPKDVTDGYSLEIRNDEIWITEKVTICCFKNKPKIKILLPSRLPLYTVALRSISSLSFPVSQKLPEISGFLLRYSKKASLLALKL